MLALSLTGEMPILVAIGAKKGGTDGIVSILRYLLDHGGNPAMPDISGKTPLHNAVEQGTFLRCPRFDPTHESFWNFA
jgi:ankyrin repeat protein